VVALLSLITVVSWGTWIPLAQAVHGVPQRTRTLYVTVGNVMFAAAALAVAGGHLGWGWRGFWLPAVGGVVWTSGNYCAFRASEAIGLARAAGSWAPLNIIVAFAWGAALFGELDGLSGTRFAVLGAALVLVVVGVLVIVSSQDVSPAGAPSPGARLGAGRQRSRAAASATVVTSVGASPTAQTGSAAVVPGGSAASPASAGLSTSAGSAASHGRPASPASLVPAESGPSAVPAGSGPSLMPAGSGPSAVPAGSGPSAVPAGSGPSAVPAGSGPSAVPAGSGPSAVLAGSPARFLPAPRAADQHRRGLVWAAAAGVLWGSYFVPAQWAGVSAQVSDFPLAIGMLVGGLALALPGSEPVRLPARGAIANLAAGLLFGIGNLALLGLVSRVGTGVGFTIGQLSLLVNASIGIWLFKVPPPGSRAAKLAVVGILIAGSGGAVIGVLR
jgi:glucose uptake protein GlcU